MVEAILNACRRNIEVTLYLDLGLTPTIVVVVNCSSPIIFYSGFNDQGEMLPFQGGANESVIHKMYTLLGTEHKQHNLRVYWYTSKDQQTPVSASDKTRNCHGMCTFYRLSYS